MSYGYCPEPLKSDFVFSNKIFPKVSAQCHAGAHNKEKDFIGFTIDKNLLSFTQKNSIVLHCLPAYRGKEITDEVIESSNSKIFDQAENRMHAQQALLSLILS